MEVGIMDCMWGLEVTNDHSKQVGYWLVVVKLWWWELEWVALAAMASGLWWWGLELGSHDSLF